MGRPLIRRSPELVQKAIMRTQLFSAIALLALATPTFAADDGVTGTWRVQGKVSAFAFDLTCRFEQKGQALGGVCYDGGTNKPHPLTHGEVSGDHVSWTYQSSYLLTKFDAAYSGTLSGGSIKGGLTVPGHEGNFTAEKQP